MIKCTIVDNGTLANRRGSLTIDDEGTPTQETVLIENGILKRYMLDKTKWSTNESSPVLEMLGVNPMLTFPCQE